jgi:GAF domain-containing protein
VFGIRHSGSKAVILHTTENTPEFEDAIRADSVIKQDASRGESDAQLIIPIKLRGETIGTLKIRASGERKWTNDDVEIASSIIERAAITLENARLLFDSQKRADKERVIGEITTKIGSFISKDNILQSAAAEIGRIMPGTEVVVQLQKNTGNGKES